ncbi:MAG: DUF2442 domain-containing protein [Bacteroidales bacterium]|nr:DUF2442 domain-containing protein [Bacteroidales bacterium]
MKITEIWFSGDMICCRDENGQQHMQSLLWYPRLLSATESERNDYTIGFDGIHWRNLDEDISFESFEYEDAVPSSFQSFFLRHREINVSEVAKTIGINVSLLRNYINGDKRPSQERINEILSYLHRLGKEYSECTF